MFIRAQKKHARFFETVIRYLGGLLSAYALSHDPILVSRADDLGAALLPVFNTTSGIPAYGVFTDNGELARGWTGNSSLWSEILSCQLEYKYLAYLTGRTPYYTAVENVMEIMYAANLTLYGDLFPSMWSTDTGLPKSRMSLPLWTCSACVLTVSQKRSQSAHLQIARMSICSSSGSSLAAQIPKLVTCV